MAGVRKVPSALMRAPGAVREVWGRARDRAAGRHGAGTRVFHVVLALGEDARRLTRSGKATPPPPDTVTPDAASPARDTVQDDDTALAEQAVRADESMGKQELYRLARELDIPGRSRMSKRELAEAIRQTARPS